MFNYTSETIINSNKGNLNVGSAEGIRYAAVGPNLGRTDYEVKTAAGADVDTLIVDGVTTLKVKDIKLISKVAHQDETKAKLTFDISSNFPTSGAEVIRLTLRLTEQGRSSVGLQNAYLHKSKPFVYEIPATGWSLDKLAKMINKDMQEGFKYVKATATSSTVLTIDALDCYIRFANDGGEVVGKGEASGVIEAIKYDASTDGVGEYKVSEVNGTVAEVGKQGVGTVAHLIKDLRIPTSASTDPFHGDHGGMPVPGGKYDQWLIEVVTPRYGKASNGLVGGMGESLTSFVFFIENAAKGEWEKAMTACGWKNAAVAGVESSSVAPTVAVEANAKKIAEKHPA